jgi:hypothetical protein
MRIARKNFIVRKFVLKQDSVLSHNESVSTLF